MAVAGAVMILAVCRLLADAGNRLGYVIGYGAVATAFIGAGLLTWERRPGHRVGLLMLAIGFTWLLPPLRYSGASVPWTLGFLLLPTLNVAVLAHLVFAYPSGRVRSGAERAVIAWAYLDATLGSLVVAAFHPDPASAGFAGFPRNLVLVDPDEAVWRTLIDVQAINRNGLAVAVLALVVRRWARATGPARRRLAPVVFAGLIAALLFSTGAAALGYSWRYAPDWVQNWRDMRWVVLVAYGLVPLGFFLGLLRERLDRSAVAGLIVELEGAPSSELRRALVKALREPSLELLRWEPARRRFEHEDGTPAALPPERPGRAHTVVERDGEPIGAIVYDEALRLDARLLEAVSAAVRLTLENERLNVELRAQLQEVKASRARILEAGDRERRRLERNVHDGAQQQLVALSMLLALARRGAEGQHARRLEEAAALTARALAEIRALARGLHPAILAEDGLSGALEQLADASPLPVRVLELPDERLPEPVEVAAYFAVAEALVNVVKYAGAGEATIRARRLDGHLLVDVTDDGTGGADPSRGTGLRGLSDRVAALDGRVEVRSPPGAGTCVHVELPCG
jgi:signal transduction histidine kinase